MELQTYIVKLSKHWRKPIIKITIFDLPTTLFVAFFVCLGKFLPEQVCETMVLLCKLLFFVLARDIIGYLYRTVCLVVDLSNREKVFIVTLGPAVMQYETNQSCESLSVWFFLTIRKNSFSLK